jgi:hypothetical protein
MLSPASAIIKQFTEHFNTGDNDFFFVFLDTKDFNFVIHLQLSTLYTACSNSATSGNREYILDRHKERLVRITNRFRNVLVNSIHKFHDLVAPFTLPDLQELSEQNRG